MAEYVMSYPFRVDTVNRRFSVVPQGSDMYKAEQVKAFLRTSSDERPIFPTFGIDEPTFHTFDSGKFYDDFIDFYPSSIPIRDITLVEVNGALSNVVVEFE